ncbi:MAG: hypothetical protein MZU95_02005 [Desulfomicrobium escambiense]|nr:hypothetical protein [Desulfomicrobium escambiense]
MNEPRSCDNFGLRSEKGRPYEEDAIQRAPQEARRQDDRVLRLGDARRVLRGLIPEHMAVRTTGRPLRRQPHGRGPGHAASDALTCRAAPHPQRRRQARRRPGPVHRPC